ncbi:MAG: RNA polymerase sigma factor [Ruminococcaceae bacterium]|nr:RNA polymerase sigma factor [Oscillospiraceae bacterium]
MEDKDIIALYYARNEDAIRESSDKYGTYVKGISMSILKNISDAEECVNDTWLKAWRSIPPQNPPSLKVYLGRLVRHLSIDRLRTLTRLKRNREYDVALDELSECAAPDDEDVTALTSALNEFLDELEPQDRKLFVGRYWHLYPVSKLAAAYGLTANNTSVRLHRLRERLRIHLSERGFTV